MSVFTWSVYNGANYYLDVFGNRFQKELEALKKDVAKWQTSPEISAKTPSVEESQAAAARGFGIGASALTDETAHNKLVERQDSGATSTGADYNTGGGDASKRSAT